MGDMFGGGGKSPEVRYEPVESQGFKAVIKKARSALLATKGGIAGEEVNSVVSRGTLLGN